MLTALIGIHGPGQSYVRAIYLVDDRFRMRFKISCLYRILLNCPVLMVVLICAFIGNIFIKPRWWIYLCSSSVLI